MARVRVREVVGTLRVVDGESLLTGPMLERLVQAVIEATTAHQQDEHSRQRDTRIGAGGGGCEDGHR